MIVVLLTVVHIFVCLVLIGVVLLQTGKRADLAGAFGGGGSQTAFGPRGAATFLSKATTGFAVAFMFTSIGLSVMAARSVSSSSESVLDVIPDPAAVEQTVPADEAVPSDPSALPPVTEESTSDAPASGSDTPIEPPEEDEQ